MTAYITEQIVKLSDCPKGEYLKRKPESNKVYIRGDYDRSTKTYSLIDTDDINREIFLKGSTKVFVGFNY